nr:hypothetical protein HK105_004731 [Polyrhizophydium stewartii]
MDGGAGDLVVEDTVRFRIFRAPQAVNNRGPITPGDCTAVALLVHDLAHGYLWHHEPPAIALVPAAGAVPTHLAGAVRYGDAVDDEWFVVHLLAAVSSRLDDLVVSVTDNDGDFLLIEAADDLPRWLDPSTSTNRVFLHRGRACGFEMLYNSLHLRNTSAKSLNQQTIETYNFEADPQWRKLRARLNKAGYFRGELEGSQAFVLLERAAKQQHLNATQTDSGSESNDDSDGASADLNEEELAELDNMKQIFQGFESFVGKESGLSGALFPNQSDEDDEDDEERDEGDDAQGIHLDPQSFLEHVMSVLSMGDDSRKPSNLPSSSRQATGNVDSDDEDDFDSEHEAVYDTELQRYMDLMDRELFSTKIAGDFERERPAHLAERPGSNSEPDDGDESDDSDDDFQPVDLDANLVKNALESFEAQQGLAGPVSNIILSLGLRLPTPQRDSQPSGRTDRAMNR